MSVQEAYRPGDVTIRINGTDYPLRLTLGALAQIEAAFGSLGDLGSRFDAPSVEDLLTILSALLHAGGAPLSRDTLNDSDLSLSDAAAAISAVFSTLSDDQTTANGKNSAVAAKEQDRDATGNQTAGPEKPWPAGSSEV